MSLFGLLNSVAVGLGRLLFRDTENECERNVHLMILITLSRRALKSVVSEGRMQCPHSHGKPCERIPQGGSYSFGFTNLKAMWLFVWHMTPSWHASQGGGFSDPPSTYVQPAVAAANPMAQGMNGSEGECTIEAGSHALCCDPKGEIVPVLQLSSMERAILHFSGSCCSSPRALMC